jgi:8-oxo-dGTP pyrophosphatase MutT (NUDIX family)
MINSIRSFGVILYNIDIPTNKPYFLIYQRRDTFEYTDFLSGLYYQKRHLITLLSLISKEERERLLNHSFDQLWKDMWLNTNCKMYKEKYEYAKTRFELIKSDLPYLFFSLGTTNEQAPWGFPKGKKMMKETELDCALREFEEEVRIPITKEYNVMQDQSILECYKGSNRKSYSTVYFLVESPNRLIPEKINISDRIRDKTISDEASDVKWVSLEESKMYLSDKRQKILQQVTDFISKKFH